MEDQNYLNVVKDSTLQSSAKAASDTWGQKQPDDWSPPRRASQEQGVLGALTANPGDETWAHPSWSPPALSGRPPWAVGQNTPPGRGRRRLRLQLQLRSGVLTRQGSCPETTPSRHVWAVTCATRFRILGRLRGNLPWTSLAFNVFGEEQSATCFVNLFPGTQMTSNHKTFDNNVGGNISIEFKHLYSFITKKMYIEDDHDWYSASLGSSTALVLKETGIRLLWL